MIGIGMGKYQCARFPGKRIQPRRILPVISIYMHMITGFRFSDDQYVHTAFLRRYMQRCQLVQAVLPFRFMHPIGFEIVQRMIYTDLAMTTVYKGIIFLVAVIDTATMITIRTITVFFAMRT